MRKMLIAGNWKMNLDREHATQLTSSILESSGDSGPDIVLCPPYLLIPPVLEIVRDSRIQVGAQNLFWEKKGAYTGEISASMILNAGCTHVIIGHSERRQIFGETDISVQRKTAAALEAGLIPIVCVGETLEEREEGRTEIVIERQISGGLERIPQEILGDIIIAYEPVWAIGTGQTATPETAQEVHKQIRSWLKDTYSKSLAEDVRILYGGSVKGENAAELFGQDDIDGGLVGGASLDAEGFAQIIAAAR
ncbi:triose-phosphate isomerase [bacterium]|nr:triose-phosphate isomerase [bacterium]